jgi:hypothetical protein
MRGLVWAAYFFAAGYVVAKLEPDIGTVVREGYDRLIDYTVTRALTPAPAPGADPVSHRLIDGQRQKVAQG